MSDFGSQFKALNEHISQAAKGVYNKIDQWSFKMLVDCLKSNDYDVVAEAVDQLVKEKKSLGVPPLYFVSRAHPNVHVRQKALQALQQMGLDGEIAQATKDMALEDATKALIVKYGNYKG